MRKSLWLLGSAALWAACSSGPPDTCSRADRTGTYKVVLFNEGGNCGEVPTEIVQITNGVVKSAGTASCRVSNERWSENDCKYESTSTCTQPDGTTTTTVGFSRVVEEGGTKIEGISTVDVRTAKGDTCRGTYRAVALRQ